jgi:hypothetical protein
MVIHKLIDSFVSFAFRSIFDLENCEVIVNTTNNKALTKKMVGSKYMIISVYWNKVPYSCDGLQFFQNSY